MAVYKRKPPTIEAIQWNGENLEEIKAVCGYYSLSVNDEKALVLTGCLTGDMACDIDDWVISGLDDMVSVLSDYRFKRTYEKDADFGS